MAISANTVWEVRTTGNDQNGGGFVTGASGTDYSQQDTAQFAFSNISGFSVATDIVSPTSSFTTAMVGNIIYLTGGSVGPAFTTGWYQIVAFISTSRIQLDRANGGGSFTVNGTCNIGGALQTIQQALTNQTNGQNIYIKGGTYTITSALNPASGSFSTDTKMIGYSTVRGDNGRPIIQAGAAVNGWVNTTNDNYSLYNFEFDGNSTGLTGANNSGASFPGFMVNCIFHDWTTSGVIGVTVAIQDCEVYNCAGTNGAIEAANNIIATRCYSHDNTKTGFYSGSYFFNIFNNCISESNSGASSDGFQSVGGGTYVNCVAYNNGRDGIRYASYQFYCDASNCILVSNAGYGINSNGISINSSVKQSQYSNNAFYNNTSGQVHNLSPLNSVTLSGDPFTNASGGDFSLNNTAGAGASCRAAGLPGVIGAGTGYIDVGALQHQDPAGGGGGSLVADGLISVV